MTWYTAASVTATNGSDIVRVISGEPIDAIRPHDGLVIGQFNAVDILTTYTETTSPNDEIIKLVAVWPHATQTTQAAHIVPTATHFNAGADALKRAKDTLTIQLGSFLNFGSQAAGTVTFAGVGVGVPDITIRCINQWGMDLAALETQVAGSVGDVSAIDTQVNGTGGLLEVTAKAASDLATVDGILSGYKSDTFAYRNTTLIYRDTTLGYRDAALDYRDTTLMYRNEVNASKSTVTSELALTVAAKDAAIVAKNAAETAESNAASIAGGDFVVNSRTVNGKLLNADIILDAEDIKVDGVLSIKPIVELFTPNSVVSVLSGRLSSSRSTPATYVDRYGVLKTVGPDVIRMNEKGVLIEGASTNLMINSESLSSIGIMAGTSVTTNAGTLPEGRQFNEATFNTAYSARFWQSLALTAGEYTVSFWLWVETGTGVARLAGYDDETYIYGPNIPLTTTPTRHEFTYTTTNAGLQVVSVFNGSDQTPRTIRWVGCQVENLPFASSYIPTAGSPVTRAADSIYIEPIGNLPELNIIKGFTVSAEVNALHEGGDLILNKYIWGLYPNSNEHLIMKLSPGNFLTVGSRSDATMYQASVDTINQTGMAQKLVGVYESSGAVKAYVDYVETQGGQNLTGKWMDWNFTGGYKIAIGGYNTSQNLKLWGYIKNFRFFDQALTADQVKLL